MKSQSASAAKLALSTGYTLCPLKVLELASDGHRHYCMLGVLLHSGGSQKLSKAIKFGFASFYHDQSYTVQAY